MVSSLQEISENYDFKDHISQIYEPTINYINNNPIIGDNKYYHSINSLLNINSENNSSIKSNRLKFLSEDDSIFYYYMENEPVNVSYFNVFIKKSIDKTDLSDAINKEILPELTYKKYLLLRRRIEEVIHLYTDIFVKK